MGWPPGDGGSPSAARGRYARPRRRRDATRARRHTTVHLASDAGQRRRPERSGPDRRRRRRLSARGAAPARRTRAPRAGSRPAGSRASTPRRSRTPSARSARAGTRRAAARPTCGSPGRGPADPWCRGARRCARRRTPRRARRGSTRRRRARAGTTRTASAISRAPAVADGDVDVQARRRRRWRPAAARSASRGLVGQQVERADDLEPPAPRRGERRSTASSMIVEQRLELVGAAREVVGGEHPQRDDLDADVLAPLEQVGDLVRARAGARRRVDSPRLRAQRRLPSRITPTCRGSPSCGSDAASRRSYSP